MNDFMFDTVVFNKLLDGSFTLNQFKANLKFYATHIQEDELNNTPSLDRRGQLYRVFTAFIGRNLPTESTVLDVSRLGKSKLGSGGLIPTETMVWGVGRWGQGKWGANGNLYADIRSRLDDLKKKKNNVQDALIAETAICNKLCLVTDDKNLCQVAREFGGAAISVQEFKKEALG